MLIRKFKNNTAASSAIRSAIKEEAGDGYRWYEMLQGLRKMNGKALMAMPFVPEIN